MKILCPQCKESINLGYLEKVGDQMAICPKCGTVVAATFKKDDKRFYWEVFLERPRAKRDPRKNPGGCGCRTLLWVAILTSIIFAMARCDWKVPYKPPDELLEEPIQN